MTDSLSKNSTAEFGSIKLKVPTSDTESPN